MLINKGAEVSLVNKLSRTLLRRFARLRYKAATKLLVNKGLVITIEDNNGRIARDIAKERSLKHVIKAFNSKEPSFIIYKDYIILL